MALGDLVRTIFVRIKEDGADQVKAAIDDVAARAAALSAMDPTVHIKVDSQGFLALRAMKTELDALTSSGDRAGLGALAARLKDFGTAADSDRLKAAALALELRALKGEAQAAAGDGGGGGLSMLSNALGTLGGLIGVGGGSTSAGSVAGSPVGIAAILTGLSSGLLGMIPAAAAAAGGIAAFGALAYPAFSTVTGAVTTLQADTLAYKQAIGDVAKDQALHTIRQEWQSLDGPQKAAVKGVQGLQAAFGQLAKAFEPSAMKVFGDFLQIAHTLLPQIVPFAQTAATAIGGLLTNFEKFAKSPGFAQFRSEMLKLEGPAITTIGEGLGQILVAVGKLLIALSNPQALRSFTILVDILAGAITGLAWVVKTLTGDIIYTFHAIAVVFDWLRHAAADMGNHIAGTFDRLRHDVATWGAAFGSDLAWAGRTMASWVSDVIRFGGQVLSWFQQLPGKIAGFLSSLPGLLFQAGKNAIQALINGILSMVGPVGSAVNSIMNVVRSFLPFSPAKQGPLSGSGAPFISGQRLVEDFAAGISSRTGNLGGAAAGLAGAVAMGGGGRGGITVEVSVPPGGAILGPAFWTALANGIRTRGGDPAIIQRKVKFA